jgi:anti-sigma B factor antagonist
MLAEPRPSAREADRTVVPGALDFGVSIRSVGDEAHLHVTGDLDCYTSPDLRAALLEALEESPRLVVLDLGGCSFIDSTALGVLVGALRRVRQAGGDMQLRSLTPATVRLFEVTGMAKLFSSA